MKNQFLVLPRDARQAAALGFKIVAIADDSVTFRSKNVEVNLLRDESLDHAVVDYLRKLG